jgi:hypothetical protein
MIELPTGQNQRVGELPPRIRAGFTPFGGRRGVSIASGQTHTGWVRIALPEVVVGRLD